MRVRGDNAVAAKSSRKRTPVKKKTVSKKKASRSAAAGSTLVGMRNKPLSKLTDEALGSYFASLNGHKPCDLYHLVMGEVEKPLFRAVMGYTNGNQSEAAEILGINRGTLRRKLRTYALKDE
jgi:Fis family transcriptional regulator, factor for inversion stimulation protein